MLVIVTFVLLSVIWGSTWLFIKVGLDDLTPFWFASGRFTVALIPLIALLLIRGKKLPRRIQDWQLMGVTGLLIFGTNYGLVFWGENYISSGLAAILYTFLPLFGMVISHFYRRTEVFTLAKLAGICMGIVGIGIIFRSQLLIADASALWGSLAILCAALATAFGSVLIKAHGTHMETVTLTTGQMVAGLLPLILIALLFEPFPDLAALPNRAWLGLVYLGVFGSALTFVLVNWLIKKIAVTTTQLIPFASTLLAVALGAFFLDEPLQSGTTLGGSLVLLGLLIATRSGKTNQGLAGQPTIVDTSQSAE